MRPNATRLAPAAHPTPDKTNEKSYSCPLVWFVVWTDLNMLPTATALLQVLLKVEAQQIDSGSRYYGHGGRHRCHHQYYRPRHHITACTTSPRAASAHFFLSPSCRHLDTPDATEWLAG
jgi:hypothetical protein